MMKTCEMATKGIEQLLAARLYGYALLQRGFADAPDRIFVDAFCGEDAGLAINLVSCEGEAPCSYAASAAYDASSALLRNADEDALSTLQSEYTKLFVGRSALSAPPWESQYVGGGTSLFQESTMVVRRLYRKHGCAPDGATLVADDHLALELDFMKHLATQTIERCECGDQAQATRLLAVQESFVCEHLLCWTDDFAARVVAQGSKLFYAELARMLVAFLQSDRLRLASLSAGEWRF